MLKRIFLFSVILVLLIGSISDAKSVIKLYKVKNAGELSKYVGKKVIVEGKISNIMWQHIMGFYKTHPFHNYFDIGKAQIVVYSKKQIEEKGKIKVSGTVVEIRGGGKKGENTKVDNTYVEYHILADSFTKL